MAWSSSAESCGDSITELFKHLCKLHCVSDRKVSLHRPKTSTLPTQRKALRTLYDVLFEYHLGDLKHCDRLSTFHSMTPDLWMFEYIYDLRRGRQFDKADKLEKLFTHLQNDDSVDLSEMDSVLTILLLLADTSPATGPHTIGHEDQHLPVVVYRKKDDGHLLPEGPVLYRDSAVYKPDSAHYMHYPRSLFEGEPLTDLGYLSMESSLSDDLDLSSKGSLFGGLVQPKQIALNDRLELPDFPESGIFEIHIPQKRERQAPPVTLDTSVMSSGFISDVQLRPSTTHWDDCLNMTQSQFFTWDKRGRRGPTERPYMTELGQRGVQEWSKIKRRELCLFSPDLQPPPVRKFNPRQVTQDLLHLMIGIPSHLFIINKELQTFYLGEGCELHGLTPEAFQSFVGDFIDCGTRYCRLRAFCASSTIYNGGLIFQAFLVALNRVLHHYAAVVLSIQSLNILQLKFLCHKLFAQMKYLSTMCHCEQPVRMQQLEAFPKGVELLSYLYQETADSINTDNYPMMLSILQTSCGPYNLFMKEWVYHGVLSDIYGEFMITVNDDYLRFRDKHYWSHSYTMMDHDVEFVPGFLHNLASDIFICGKSLNLLKTCSPHHFLCEVKELDIPRISLTFSDSELRNTMIQCQMYISKMKQIARQQTMSRQAAEDQVRERKRDLMRRAKAAATKEVERIQEAILKKRTLADAKKREQFAILKKQMEEDLQRRSDSVLMEKKADKERMELLLIQEREMTEKEKELEAEARAEIIDYYAKLTKEATEREEKAMWKIRRSVLNEARRNFLSEDEQAWREEMEANPEGRKIDRALWENKRSDEADLDLPAWARRVIAKPAPLIPAIEEPEEVQLPAWAARRLSSLEKESGHLSEHQPEVSRGRRVNMESEESTNKPTIHVFPEHHPSKETTDLTSAKPHIHIVSDRHSSKESEPIKSTKIGVKLSSHMSATTETESKEYKPHLKSHGDRNATKESTKTKEVSFPKLKGQVGTGVSAETQEKEWKVKPASLYGHVSQLSKQEVQINVPRLKRPEEIYASLESDYKDFGIKPRIRMSKKMSATKESEASDAPRSGIKFSSVMSSTKESEWIDTDKARLEKFKRQNVYGHSSDSTVQALLYGLKKDKAAVDERPAIPPIEWTSSIQYTPVPYQDNFDICCQPPVVDLLMMSSGMVYGGHGDYGISQMTDVDVYDYLPLTEIMERSVVAPLASQISLVNESLLDYFFVELHLMDHLKALRRYLLMENGDFAQMLSDMLFEKISSPISAREMLTPLFLNGALSKALKSTTQTDDKLAENLSFAFKYPPGHIPAKGRSILDCMELRYIVSWPVNIVITEESVNKYNQIFSFMVLQKQTVWVLKDVWHRLKRAALFHKAGNASQFRRLQLYRQEMQHFVRVMQGYISHQVIFVTWNEFKASLKSDVQNLDDLIRVHDDYLDRAIFRCLLNTKAAKIMKIMRDMFSLILQFRTLLVAADWRRDKTTGEVSHANFNHMLKCFQNFRQYSIFLFKVISKLVKRGYQSHLQDFLLRLNFNDYYRDT